MKEVIQSISWQETIPLRHQVLWPNHPPSFSQVDGDEDALHFGAFFEDELICVASLFLQDDKAQVRKVATLPQYQGRGVGSRMIQHLIQEAGNNEVREFWCYGRVAVCGFYERLGMTQMGEPFERAGVPFVKMSRQLA